MSRSKRLVRQRGAVAAERVGREVRKYVSNIFTCHIAYTLATKQLEAKTAAAK